MPSNSRKWGTRGHFLEKNSLILGKTFEEDGTESEEEAPPTRSNHVNPLASSQGPTSEWPPQVQWCQKEPQPGALGRNTATAGGLGGKRQAKSPAPLTPSLPTPQAWLAGRTWTWPAGKTNETKTLAAGGSAGRPRGDECALPLPASGCEGRAPQLTHLADSPWGRGSGEWQTGLVP